MIRESRSGQLGRRVLLFKNNDFPGVDEGACAGLALNHSFIKVHERFCVHDSVKIIVLRCSSHLITAIYSL
jgi:hypothetical protein